MKRVRMIDPPSGWKYGFPKALPDGILNYEDQINWIISQGYPKKLIDAYGQHFNIRYWIHEENEDGHESQTIS